MITKINNIKDFGVFKNFSGGTMPDFKTFNLIYGWNYSGKTTLSRVFRCFENSSLHPDYQNATFSFQGDAVTTFDQNFGASPNVRVFNSDFIKENLKWDNNDFEPIFLLGAQNIQLQNELDIKQKKYDAEKTSIEQARRATEAKLQSINTALTNKAREVTNLLGLGRIFDRDRFKEIVESIIGNTDQYKLSEADFEKYKIQALSNEQKPYIPNIEIAIPAIKLVETNTLSILARQLLTSNKLQNLLDNKTLSDWVERGKDLHINKTNCEFCGNSLPETLLTRLNEHFSKDYEILKSDINSQVEEIRKLSIKPTIPAETAFYRDLITEFEDIKLSVENETQKFIHTLTELEKSLNEKKERPFEQIKIHAIEDNTKELNDAIHSLNQLIDKNNQRTQDFQLEKNAAIQKIKEDYAAKFEESERYSLIVKALEGEKNDTLARERNNDTLNSEILVIKAQLDETVKGAEKVNEALRQFFGKDDIKITTTPEKKFQLKRGTDIAKNLSEGERTAISFAYFITKLEQQNNKLIDTIVYIDDPISSLDSTHLFNIYSFIKTTFYEKVLDQTSGRTIYKETCKQLFISTHNYDFHNLIYGWFVKIKGPKKDFFMVERHKNSHKDESVIKKNSNLITRFNSEYAYLFSILNAFQMSPEDTNDNLYQLPNITRRFLETYLNFKYMSYVNIEQNIEQLITDKVDCEKVRKFVHYFTHSLTTDKFVKFADLSECESVVNIVINAIENNDPTHFASLQEAIKNTED